MAKRFIMLTAPPAKKARMQQTPLAGCTPGMTNLSVQAKVAFVSFPHTSQTGVAKVIAELYDASLASHAREPIKLTVMGEDNVAAMLRVKFHAVVELDGASCTDYQNITLIVGEDVALSLRILGEGEVQLPELPQIE
eukprot:6061422-Amphidinium_carterae.1